jgi:hypothetical protein
VTDAATPDAPPAAPEATAAAQQVATAGGTPAQAENAAAQAQEAASPRMSDEDVKRVSAGIVDDMESRGLFDSAEQTPPETPAQPAQPETPPAGQPTEAAQEAVESDTKPGRSVAERFFGVNRDGK